MTMLKKLLHNGVARLNNSNKLDVLIQQSCESNLIQLHNVRHLFGFGTDVTKKKDFRRQELVGYSRDQMYDVVADVNNCKFFVPYCQKSSVYNRKGETANADLVVGFPPLYETYTSNLKMARPKYVISECYDGRLFKYLQNYWGFSEGVKDVPNSCVVDFRVTFEFKSALHSHLSHLFFDAIVKQMEKAFVLEAERRYGQASIKTLLISQKRT